VRKDHLLEYLLYDSSVLRFQQSAPASPGGPDGVYGVTLADSLNDLALTRSARERERARHSRGTHDVVLNALVLSVR
jgi:hypothetical protein